jgi:hypothetical protein
MYYLVETRYFGPNQDDDNYADADTIEITTNPPRANMNEKKRTNGWCGNTSGWAVYGHGEYETLGEARKAMVDLFGAARETSASGDGIVEKDKICEYERLGHEATENWLYAAMEEDVKADTTDDEIFDLCEQYEALANEEGLTLDGNFTEELLVERRSTLRKKCIEIDEEIPY